MFILRKIIDLEKKPEAQTVSLDDPRLNEMPRVSVQSILSNQNIIRQIPKLSTWLESHKIINDALYFRFIDNRMLPGDIQLRDQLIQLQMYLTLKLVMQFEKFINDGSSGVKSEVQHPCPELKSISRIQDLWRQVLALEANIVEFRKLISSNCIEYTRKLKDSVAYCASLLASKDVIPPYYIPIVDFAKLDLSNDMIASLDQNSVDFVTKLSLCEIKQKQYINAILSLKSKYTETPENPLINQLNICLAASPDQQPALFEDFLQCVRPKLRQVNDFFTTPNKVNYKNLVRGLIEKFSLPPKHWNTIRRLCAEVAAPLCAPNIKFNGNGCENEEFMVKGLVAASTLSPYSLLSILGGEDGISTIEGLKALTPNWKDIVNYTADMLDTESLDHNDTNLLNQMHSYAEAPLIMFD